MSAKVLAVKITVLLALLAGISTAGVKYVAVVETEVDSRSGASANLTQAEVAQITTALRREAVNNLPRSAYSVLTMETVFAQGGAVLEECADENCVITLGSKIGADYIVRGIISMFGTRLTLSVDMYETEDGILVASSDPVRSEKSDELLEMATAACAKMYKKFAAAQSSAAPTAQRSAQETAGAAQTVSGGGGRESVSKRRPMTGFSLGSGFSPSGDGHWAGQLGVVHSRPIIELISLNAEGNIWIGNAVYYNGDSFFYGINAPLTVLLYLPPFSLEAGVDGDALFSGKETLLNAGFVIGAGIGFSEKRSRRYFYRYCGGYNYRTHVVGMRFLF